MSNFTKANIECLANMPMLVDAMSDTIEKLQEVLMTYYPKIEEELSDFFNNNKRLRYGITRERENGCIYAFSDDYKKHHLPKPERIMKITSRIEFAKTTKNSTNNEFAVQYGYWNEDNENEIYFLISGKSPVVKKLGESFGKTTNENMLIDDDKVDIQLPITADFSEEQIEKTFEEFRDNILRPFLELLKGKTL